MESPTHSISELRLFQAESEEVSADEISSNELWRQIPALPQVMECFESATGWELAFKESRSDVMRRNAQGSDAIVRGSLEIIDMSQRVEPGQVAGHRQRCNQLADAIGELISLLQHNRESIQALKRQLTSVVDTPFEWWGIAGQTGYCDGVISSWSISPKEQIRLFNANVSSINPTDLAIGSSAILAAFESSCQIGISLDQVAILLPRILRSSCQQGQQLNEFATVELDPITGEFQIDGYESSSCVTLLDLSAGALVDLECEGWQGVLYSGQLLLVGLSESQRGELLEVIHHTEMTAGEFRRIFERKFSDSAALMMYRK